MIHSSNPYFAEAFRRLAEEGRTPEQQAKLEALRARHQDAMDAVIQDARDYVAETKARVNSIQDPVMKAAVLKSMKEN